MGRTTRLHLVLSVFCALMSVQYKGTAAEKPAVTPASKPTAPTPAAQVPAKAEPEKLAPLDSPPAKVVLAFLKAAHARNKIGMKRYLPVEMAPRLEDEEGQTLVETIVGFDLSRTKVTKVVMVGTDRAAVTLEYTAAGSKGSVRLHAARINGEWKVVLN